MSYENESFDLFDGVDTSGTIYDGRREVANEGQNRLLSSIIDMAQPYMNKLFEKEYKSPKPVTVYEEKEEVDSVEVKLETEEEKQIEKICRLVCPKEVVGKIVVTTSRLRFFSKQENRVEMYLPSVLSAHVEKTEFNHATVIVLRVASKLPRKESKIRFTKEIDAQEAADVILELSTRRSLEVSTRPPSWNYCGNEYPWRAYGFEEFYSRLNLSESPYEITNYNSDYSLCDTYPAKLVIPKNVSKQSLLEVAKFRKRQRIPVLSYCLGKDHLFAGLWRCSQPMIGISGERCREDELMCSKLATRRGLAIFDLREKKVAFLNRAGGGGSENRKHYAAEISFLNIANIHYIRQAYQTVCQSLFESENILLDFANSGWLEYLQAILKAAEKSATELLSSKACLIHCSDGWDRTPQVCALVQLLLDPEARTCLGFQRLVCREFQAFGHQFGLRLAMGRPVASEYSPIFFQFLDCVYQILRQNYTAFEFTGRSLARIAEVSVSGLYGDFFCDSERERGKLKKKSRSYFDHDLERNTCYSRINEPIQINCGRLEMFREFWFSDEKTPEEILEAFLRERE